MSSTLANEANQRGLKDFLTLYNTITEYCFNKCVSNFNERSASGQERSCIEVCTDNYVQFNQRFMFNFVDHQERRKRETEAAAIEAAKKEALAAQEAQAQQAAEVLESLSAASSDTSSMVNLDAAALSNQQVSLAAPENPSVPDVPSPAEVLSFPENNSVVETAPVAPSSLPSAENSLKNV
ncbi:mitochondrial import inner membrane translocase subunit Tim10B [Aplysia californica]|uniref:Mitochondrial import inner membrane translocase subunit Tim10B n=1 Tax=Aplysia californica TaxID=6500 RepID=A0ABM1ACT3_APLCA|nr:mitochondrial import inner membrane translocase subunit Tim10B [Aplysia californica]XP_012945232.1 mitochondrial import inner membrane translocase subunit Tim10B [Aplysia californica]